MARGKLKSLEAEILCVAALLGEDDDGLSKEELRSELNRAGIDPERIAARFHDAALQLAENILREGQMVPLAVQQAIAATEPSAAASGTAGPKPGRPSE